jgi:hypothetical protein
VFSGRDAPVGLSGTAARTHQALDSSTDNRSGRPKAPRPYNVTKEERKRAVFALGSTDSLPGPFQITPTY